MSKTSGFRLIAAPFTPFSQDSSLRLELVPRYCAWLVEAGLDGAFVGGTTGEGSLLTTDERLALAESWIQARESAPGSFRLFIHAGHECLGDALRIAAHAAESGADAVAALAPSFFTPASIEAAVDHAARIAAAAGNLPFYYYHLPSMTGMNLSMVRFLEAALKKIPNLAGLKFTHSDLGEYADCRREFGSRLDILFGRDELLLAGLAMGAPGAVGSTYNFAAKLYRRLEAAFREGRFEEAESLQAQSRKFIETLLAGGGLSGLKAGMAGVGLDCGPCRPPLPALDETRKAELAGVVAAIIGSGVRSSAGSRGALSA